MESCGGWLGLRMRGVGAQMTAVGFPAEPLGGASHIGLFVTGDAASTATVVKWQLSFLDASDVLLGTTEVTLHSGSSGPFAATASVSALPTGATKFRARLWTRYDNAILYTAGADAGQSTCCIDCPDGAGGTFKVCDFIEGGSCIAECPPEDPFGECDPETWPA